MGKKVNAEVNVHIQRVGKQSGKTGNTVKKAAENTSKKTTGKTLQDALSGKIKGLGTADPRKIDNSKELNRLHGQTKYEGIFGTRQSYTTPVSTVFEPRTAVAAEQAAQSVPGLGKAPVPPKSDPVSWTKYAAEHGTNYTQPKYVEPVFRQEVGGQQKMYNELFGMGEQVRTPQSDAAVEAVKKQLNGKTDYAKLAEDLVSKPNSPAKHKELQDAYTKLFGMGEQVRTPQSDAAVDAVKKQLSGKTDYAKLAEDLVSKPNSPEKHNELQKMYQGLFGGGKLGPVDPKTIDNSRELDRIRKLAHDDKQKMYEGLFGGAEPKGNGIWSKIKDFANTKGGKAALIIGGIAAAAALGYGIYKLVQHCRNKKAEEAVEPTPVVPTPEPVVPTPEPVKPLPTATVTTTEENNFVTIKTGGLTWAEIVTAYYPEVVEKHDVKGAIAILKQELNNCSDKDLRKETDIPKTLNLPRVLDGTNIKEDANPHRIKITKGGGHTDVKEAGCKETTTTYTVTDKETGKTVTDKSLEEALNKLKAETGAEDYQLDMAS